MADTPPNSIDRLVFLPDHFFLSPTRGRGVVRDFTGRLIDRCTIETAGRWDHNFGALHFDEAYSYDSGRIDVLNWAFAPDAQGRMSASEATIASPVRGWSEGGDYRLRFKRHGEPPLDKVFLTFDVRFTLMEADLALKIVRLKLFGVTLGTMNAYHRRLGG
jgi:hypothetical protein